IMLATFLAGIGAGSIIFAPYADNRKNPLAWFAALEAVIGLASILSIFVYGELPFIFFSLKEAFAERFWLFLFIQFLLCASIMIIPTLCMGAVFPLAGKIYARRLKAVGKGVGEAYFFNTAGSIFGAFAGGFILIPVLGAQNGVIVTAGLNIAIACALLWAARMSPFAKAAASIALTIAFAISVIALPTWDQMMMTLGLYANPANKEEVQGLRARPPERLLFYKEGINAIITVREGGPDGGIISYQANGKQEARSINGKPPVAWSLLGHLPLLLHPGNPQEALVVGLGSGITLGGMERYPLASIDVVELEPAVVEAAGFFRESNNNALDDPRVKLHIADGRKFASLMTKKYDIIVSGVSDPWITGVSNLFTYEYFGELNERLEHDGVVALWFQNYRVTPRELKTGLNTFASVFPYASVWFHYTDALDLIVIGSKEPLKFDMARLEEVTSSPSVKEGLRKIDINGPFDIVDLFLIGGSDLRSYIAGSPLNTDERPLLEFTLPRLLYSDPSIGIKNIEELLSHAEDLTPPLTIAEGEEEEFYLGLGKTYNRSNFRLPQSLKAFKKVLELNPGNKEAKYYIRGIEAEMESRPEN
ncbi:MAG: fused MFS/spermidine synthase, partial [Deltaproteobacteria bacterium]|nr:fused MFS/spermidine synthase [Deltaproteobacteria bacterium]